MDLLLVILIVLGVAVALFAIYLIVDFTNTSPNTLADKIAKITTKQLRHDMYYRDWRNALVLDFNRIYGVDFIPNWNYDTPKWLLSLRYPFLVNKYLKQIHAHYTNVMELNGLQMTMKEFVWRYMHLNLGSYTYTDKEGTVHSATLIVPIEEYALLLKNDVPMKTATKLYQHGLSIEQILENHELPTEWSTSVYSNRELKDNSNS